MNQIEKDILAVKEKVKEVGRYNIACKLNIQYTTLKRFMDTDKTTVTTFKRLCNELQIDTKYIDETFDAMGNVSNIILSYGTGIAPHTILQAKSSRATSLKNFIKIYNFLGEMSSANCINCRLKCKGE